MVSKTKDTTVANPGPVKTAKKAAKGKNKPAVVKAAKPIKVIGKLIEGAAPLTKAIDSVAGRGKKLSVDIHTIACSLLVHVNKHHDVTLCHRLINAIPDMGRKVALRSWFISHGNMSWNEATKSFNYDATRTTFLDEARAVPFWKFQPEKESMPFDAQKAVSSLLARITKATAKGGSIPADAIMHLQRAKDILVRHGTKPVNMTTGEQARPAPADPLAQPIDTPLIGAALAAANTVRDAVKAQPVH